MDALLLLAAAERLRNLLIEEAPLLGTDNEKYVKLKGDLLRLRTGPPRKLQDLNSAAKITYLCCQTEDAIENYVLEVPSLSRSGSLGGKIKGMLKDLGRPNPRVKLDELIRSIQAELAEILPQAQSEVSAENCLHDKSQRLMMEDDVVGMDQDIEKLVTIVVGMPVQQQVDYAGVIPIIGMAGVGKTTLAAKVYNDERVRRHFYAFAWARVGKDHHTRRTLEEILRQLLPYARPDMITMSDVELARQLYDVLEKKKCLIVLDDIWSRGAWESLRIAFPIQKNASTILLTSRVEEVSADLGYVHRMQPLGDEESWELFKKKAFPDDTDASEKKMMELREKIIKLSGGIPLAIVVLGGQLASQDKWSERNEVYQSTEEHRQKPPQVLQALEWSYTDLPWWLKACFLYLGLFPEDSDIEVDKIFQLWMAQGIILPDEGEGGGGGEGGAGAGGEGGAGAGAGGGGGSKTLTDVAERYLDELAQRTMVQLRVDEESRFKSCRLHNLMRDLCLDKGKNEYFVRAVDLQSLSSDSSSPSSNQSANHLAIYVYDDGYLSHLNKLVAGANTERLLSLFFFNVNKSKLLASSKGLDDFIRELKCLRVLDFDQLDFRGGRLPKGLGKLIHLRYLSFRGCYLDELPSSIGNLRFLRTLDLRVNTAAVSVPLSIPNVLWALRRLWHLYLPRDFRVVGGGQEADRIKLRLGDLILLQVLGNFDPSLCDVESPSKFTKLRKLTATVEGDVVKQLLDIIRGIRQASPDLKELFLFIRNFDCYTEERLSLANKLLSFSDAHTLYIQGRLGNLPGDYHISKTLVVLELSGSVLKEDPMPTLGKLPQLNTLRLLNDAFAGSCMVCSASSFPRLRTLELFNLHGLEEWTAEEGAMPKLSHLRIQKCPRLKMHPAGFVHITTLQ